MTIPTKLMKVEGKDEFVVIPEPNVYLITVRLTPAQAEFFGNNERVSFVLRVLDEGTAGITNVRAVLADNGPGDNIFPEDQEWSAGALQVCKDLEDHMHSLVEEINEGVTDDEWEEYFSMCYAERSPLKGLVDLIKGLQDK